MQEKKALSGNLIFGSGVLLVLLIGYLDHITAANIDLSVLYLAPVAITVWFSSRRPAFIVSALAVAVWEFEEVFFRLEHFQTAAFWANLFLRLAYFVTAVIIIARLKMDYDREKKLANYDSLTGAMNRRSFETAVKKGMEECAREKKAYTLVYFDIDNFKKLNDSMGHAFGDAVLVKTSEVLMDKISEAGHFARLGGDEFAFFVPGYGRVQIRNLMDNIMSELVSGDNVLKGVTYSFGALAVERKKPDNLQELMHRADSLMYAVKKSGKNAFKIKSI